MRSELSEVRRQGKSEAARAAAEVAKSREKLALATTRLEQLETELGASREAQERAAEAKGRAKGKAEEAAKGSKQLAAERSERKLLEVKLAHLGGEMAALEARCAGHAREQVARLRQRHLEPISCPFVPPPLEPLQASVAAVRPSSAPTGHRMDGLQSARVGLQPLLHEAAPSFGPLTADSLCPVRVLPPSQRSKETLVKELRQRLEASRAAERTLQQAAAQAEERARGASADAKGKERLALELRARLEVGEASRSQVQG